MDWSPVLISMKTAGLSILITFFLGIFAAWRVVCIKSRCWKFIWDGILTLPLVLPPTVAGFFLLYIFGVKRPVGQFFLDFFSVKIAFSWGAAVIAAVTMSFPLMYRSARGAFEQVNPDLVAAARTLGMGEWTIFRKVLLANAVRTLPMAVYSEVAAGNMDSAFAYVAVIVAIAFLSILVMNAAAWRAGGGIHG